MVTQQLVIIGVSDTLGSVQQLIGAVVIVLITFTPELEPEPDFSL